jgi:hypothetical protein
MFDVAGNEYDLAEAQLANRRDNWRVWATLVTGVPTPGSITFRQVAQTSRIPLLEISGSVGSGAQKVRFRDVPMN